MTSISPTRTGAVPEGTAPTVLQVDGVSKVFGHGPAAVHALDRFSLDLRQGEFVCLVGASGCGKSTLLHLLAGLDSPTSGTGHVEGPPPGPQAGAPAGPRGDGHLEGIEAGDLFGKVPTRGHGGAPPRSADR